MARKKNKAARKDAAKRTYSTIDKAIAADQKSYPQDWWGDIASLLKPKQTAGSMRIGISELGMTPEERELKKEISGG